MPKIAFQEGTTLCRKEIKMKHKLIGILRLLFGNCPRCNSKYNQCIVCQGYPYPAWNKTIKKYWFKRFAENNYKIKE